MIWNRLCIGFTIVVFLSTFFLGCLTYFQARDINLHRQSITQHYTEIDELAGELETVTVKLNEYRSSFNESLSSLDADLAAVHDESVSRFTVLEEKVKINSQIIDIDSSRITNLERNQESLSHTINNFVPGLAGAKIYDEVSGSVVQITDGEYVCGAGFLFDTAGHVVTAAHVLENITEIYVILADGTFSRAGIVGKAQRSDIALLKLEITTNLKPAVMARPNSLAVGDDVITIGHPFGYNDSLTAGVTSRLHRTEIIRSGSSAFWLSDLIQFDAAANPGNSGGPLFDRNGKVVGMTVAGIAAIKGEGISLAVSTARILNVVGNLLQNGVSLYPTIGIHVTSLDPNRALALGENSTAGAIVTGIATDSQAAAAGIQADDIILTVNEINIGSASELASFMASLPSSTGSIIVEVKRGGQQSKITVPLTYVDETEFWVFDPDTTGFAI